MKKSKQDKNSVASAKRIIGVTVLLLLINVTTANSQPVPAREENIPHLVTFGAEAPASWGDDDHTQIFFFTVPENCKTPVYFRVFDPETGGMVDEAKGAFNTTTVYSIFGGKGCISTEDCRKTEPSGNYKAGNLLATKAFSLNPKYDNQWYTFGPFTPQDGELMQEYGGYVFKVIAQGTGGDDGNLYNYYMSSSPNENIPIEGGNAFTFEYTFRMHDDPNQVSHIYPFVDSKVVSVKQSNFDWDNDGIIRIISVAKQGELSSVSADNVWGTATHPIEEAERKTSLDIQFIKNKRTPVKKNNVVFYITNQYGEYLPFFTAPIGGIPVYKYQIAVKKVAKTTSK